MEESAVGKAWLPTVESLTDGKIRRLLAGSSTRNVGNIRTAVRFYSLITSCFT